MPSAMETESPSCWAPSLSLHGAAWVPHTTRALTWGFMASHKPARLDLHVGPQESPHLQDQAGGSLGLVGAGQGTAPLTDADLLHTRKGYFRQGIFTPRWGLGHRSRSATQPVARETRCSSPGTCHPLPPMKREFLATESTHPEVDCKDSWGQHTWPCGRLRKQDSLTANCHSQEAFQQYQGLRPGLQSEG
jgi:hypothetical protein